MPTITHLFREPNVGNFLAMTFKNDLSGTYDLEVNTSVPLDANKTITIRRITEEFNIKQGQGIEYHVGFPYNHSSPKLTSVTFNGKIYCTDPSEVATDNHHVTALSATDHFSTTIPEETIRRYITTTTTTPTIDQCGISNDHKSLIFSRRSFKVGEYPWLVAIFVESSGGFQFNCGGTLVSTKHIITAAHCTRDPSGTIIPKDDFVVILGEYNLKYWARDSTIRAIKDYYIHPDYRKPVESDIAVLVLNKPVIFSMTIRAVCLWDEDDSLHTIVGKNGTIAGWGKDESGAYSEEPNQVQLPIVSQETCLRSDIRFFKITSTRTFCAGTIGESRGPCSGDSGGGFVMNRNGLWKLRGVLSSGLLIPNTHMCDVNNYAVFTDVSKYATWLKQIMEHP